MMALFIRLSLKKKLNVLGLVLSCVLGTRCPGPFFHRVNLVNQDSRPESALTIMIFSNPNRAAEMLMTRVNEDGGEI